MEQCEPAGNARDQVERAAANGVCLSLHIQNGKNGFSSNHYPPKRKHSAAVSNGFCDKGKRQQHQHILSTSSSNRRKEEDEGGIEQGGGQELIPGLTDDLAALCLARLPRSRYGQYFTVSRKFYTKFRSGELYKVRQELGISEQWMYILSDGHQRLWRAFNPRECTWRLLPAIPSDYTFAVSDKETLAAGTQLLVRGMEVLGYVVWIYDLVMDKWIKGPDMIHPRCLYASASCGSYGFVAGGTDMKGSVLQSAERYSSQLGRWEPLAPLNTGRKLCSGFYMDGSFWVIGGKDASDQWLTCGEEYDAAAGCWRPVPSMYFGGGSGQTAAPPLVAVVDEQLYAVETWCNTLKAYDKKSNEWKTLGEVPVRADAHSGWGIAFKALEGELFIIGAAPAQNVGIWAWKPQPNAEPAWRYVTGLGSFIYNCAVMAA